MAYTNNNDTHARRPFVAEQFRVWGKFLRDRFSLDEDKAQRDEVVAVKAMFLNEDYR